MNRHSKFSVVLLKYKSCKNIWKIIENALFLHY